jgi:hypothetical protein
MVHDAPFQTSINENVPLAVVYLPTAVQEAVL